MSERWLKIDYDVEQLPPDLIERTTELLRLAGLRPVDLALNRSASGKGWHMRVLLNRPVNAQRCVALQAILGSDPRREAFNLRRVSQWRELTDYARARWNVLFTRKVEL